MTHKRAFSRLPAAVLALLTAILFAQNSRKHPELKLDAPNK